MTWRQVGTARRPRPTCKSSNPSQAGARGAPAYLSGLQECLSAGPLFKNLMTNQDYFTAAELYLGSNRQHANATARDPFEVPLRHYASRSKKRLQ